MENMKIATYWILQTTLVQINTAYHLLIHRLIYLTADMSLRTLDVQN